MWGVERMEGCVGGGMWGEWDGGENLPKQGGLNNYGSTIDGNIGSHPHDSDIFSPVRASSCTYRLTVRARGESLVIHPLCWKRTCELDQFTLRAAKRSRR